MNNNKLFRILFISFWSLLLPFLASAKNSKIELKKYASLSSFAPADSTQKKPKDVENKKDDKKDDIKKPEIKQVPKSRRQVKPIAVGAKIKIKTPVKIKPIIKRPIGLIRKTL
ncbi:MAG: hypothetical protein ABI390_00625 [Daejeonella sp.]